MVAPPPAAIVGNWQTTAFVVDGTDVHVQGMGLAITFTVESEYFSTFTNDVAGFCETGTSCSDDGEFSATATSLTLDPGTPDAVTLSYAVSGNTLTLSGTFYGSNVALTLEAF